VIEDCGAEFCGDTEAEKYQIAEMLLFLAGFTELIQHPYIVNLSYVSS